MRLCIGAAPPRASWRTAAPVQGDESTTLAPALRNANGSNESLANVTFRPPVLRPRHSCRGAPARERSRFEIMRGGNQP